MKKSAILYVMAYFGRISTIVSCIWALVEFCLYLFKDLQFNWWSIGAIGISMGISLLCVCFSIIFGLKAHKDVLTEFDKKTNGRTSKFQDRLEAAKRNRDSNNS